MLESVDKKKIGLIRRGFENIDEYLGFYFVVKGIY